MGLKKKGPFIPEPDLILEELEERIVLDAAVEPAPDQQNDTADNQNQNQGDGENANPASQGEALAPPDDAVSESLDQVYDQDLNVILISNALGEIEEFTQAVGDEATVLVYDAENDDLGSINDMLQEVVDSTNQDIDNLAFIGHGLQGGLVIGDDTITYSSMSDYQESFGVLGSMLSEDAQFQLYGCYVAGDSSGEDMLGYISTATGAEVFASSDATAGERGDWDLEYASDADVPVEYFIATEAMNTITTELEAGPGALNQGIPDITRFEDASETTLDLGDFFNNPDIVSFNVFGIAEANEVQTDNSNLLGLNVNGDELTISYNEYEFGTAVVRVEALDAAGDVIDVTTFSVTVKPVQDAIPEAEDQDLGTFNVDNPIPPISITLTGFDPDPNNIVNPGDVFFSIGGTELVDGTIINLAHGQLEVVGDIRQIPGEQRYEIDVEYTITDPEFTDGTETFDYDFHTTGNQWLGFGEQQSLGGDPVVAIDVGDLTGNGALDIVAAVRGGQDQYFLNDHENPGQFDRYFFGSDTSDTTDVLLVDLNNDGALDWVRTMLEGPDLVHLNLGWDFTNGGIIWSDGTALPGSDTRLTWTVAAGDFNNDGLQDLVTGVAYDGFGEDDSWWISDLNVVVYTNQWDGTNFNFIPTIIPDSNFGYTTALTVGDINADGFLDIYAGKQWSGALGDFVFLNTGTFNADTTPNFLTLSGFNRADGNNDRWSADASAVDINASLAGGVFLSEFMGHVNLDPTDFEFNPAFQNDISADVVTANLTNEWWGLPNRLLLSQFQEGINSFIESNITTSGDDPNHQGGTGQSLGIDWGDFDRDGIFDVAVANFCGPNEFVLGAIVNGGVEFIDSGAFQLGYGAANARDVVVADLNNDGLLDLVFATDFCDCGVTFHFNLGFGPTSTDATVILRVETTPDVPGDDDDDDDFEPELPEMTSFFDAEGLDPRISYMGSEFDADFFPRPLIPIPGFLFSVPTSGVDLPLGPYGPGPGMPPPEWGADLWEVPEFTDAGAELRPDKGEDLRLAAVEDQIYFTGPDYVERLALADILQIDDVEELPESTLMFCYADAGACFMGPSPEAGFGANLEYTYGKEIISDAPSAPGGVLDLDEPGFADSEHLLPEPESADTEAEGETGTTPSGQGTRALDMDNVKFLDIITPDKKE
jgi:Domain of unknown function (DUF4347)/FG-GAP-like repeat/FG-GAP repeat